MLDSLDITKHKMLKKSMAHHKLHKLFVFLLNKIIIFNETIIIHKTESEEPWHHSLRQALLHVDNVCKAAHFHFRALRHICGCIDEETACIVASSMVGSAAVFSIFDASNQYGASSAEKLH